MAKKKVTPHDFMVITENVNGQTVLRAEGNGLRIDFDNIGEGYNGDYDPDDPEDDELIRFYALIYDEDDGPYDEGDDRWVEIDDASYCTCIPVNTPIDELKRCITIIFNRFYDVINNIRNGESVKRLGEELSYITP